MTRSLYILCICLAAAFPCVAAGSVSLDSCRNMALKHNKSLMVANENITGAGYARKAAKAAYLPGVDFSATYMYNQHKIALLGADAKLPTMTFNPLTMSYDYNILTNPLDGKPILDPKTGTPIPTEVAVIPKEAMTYDIHNVVAGVFTVTQPVYMGGAIRAMNEITKYAEQLAISMRNSTVQDVVYSVDEAYWLVVSLVQKKKLAESYCSLLDSLQHNVYAMYDQGVATKSDCLSVDVKVNEAAVTRTKVDNGLSLARMALNQVCGVPINETFTLEDEQLEDIPLPPASVDTDASGVYARRQDLASLRHGISILEQQEKLARAEMLPKVGIMAAWSFSNPNTIDGFEKRFGGGFSVGATLTVPIWHWGGNYNKLKVAESATRAQRLQLEDAESLVDLQVSQARFKFEEAYKTLDMTRSNLKAADQNLHNAQYGFKEGVLTTDDVTAAQTAWLQAHSEVIDAEIGLQLCRVYLSKVLGTMPY
ncbi:MAG: TolC family protein [Prevotella sp.]|nr:TolC family protein [Prevotella sp.]MCM1075018.1 TolC family protein [Ruminococcus sp.]